MKLRHLKRQRVERLRWRLLLARVTEGVELRLIEQAAELLAYTAAEAVAAVYRTQVDLVHVIRQEVERSFAAVQTERR
jgi:hypothetical protein